MNLDPNDPVQFSVGFVVLWCTVCFGLSLLGGWYSLGQHYRQKEPFLGRRWHMRSATLRLVGYGNCLTVGADSKGLFLSVLFPFRIAHAPLFIPWSEIQTSPTRYFFFFPMVKLQFKQEPSVSMRFMRGLASKLAAESNGAFSYVAT